MTIYEVLKQLDIPYVKHDHVPVYTCEEAAKHCGDIPGGKSKNLFLRNRKGDQHYLLIIEASKQADLKKVGDMVEEKFSLASPERLMKWLKCEPGSVSLLALINDAEKHVKVLIDKDLWEENEILQYHPPNDNTSTLEVTTKDLQKFLTRTEHNVQFINI